MGKAKVVNIIITNANGAFTLVILINGAINRAD